MGAVLLACLCGSLFLNTGVAVKTDHASSHVVCLSRPTQVALTLQGGEACTTGDVITLVHGGREVGYWTPPCDLHLHQSFKNRVRADCLPRRCRLRLTLLQVLLEDSGSLVCRRGGSHGPRLERCGARLRVLDVADLQQSCSYSPTNRTVRCDKVTSEVKVFRKGEWSDRDIRYFSTTFHFRMGDHEEGRYAVTQETMTEEDALCSRDFEFHVEEHLSETSDPSSNKRVFGLICSLSVFLVIPLTGIDIIMQAWREMRPGQRQQESEMELLQAESECREEVEWETVL